MNKLLGRLSTKEYSWIALVTAAFVAFIIAFLYLDRHNQISAFIQSLGILGIGVAILLMAVLCMTPLPSEGLVVLYLKIYGVYWGILFSWLGSSLSSLIIFVLARTYGKRFMEKLITPERFNVVDHWVKKKGSLGLFVARLLPIPAFVVNYIAGVIPSIQLWPYFWTAALSIIPYYIATGLVYLGVSKEVWSWLFGGTIAIIAFWTTGYVLNRRTKK